MNSYVPNFKCGVTEILNTFKAKRDFGFYYEEDINAHWEVTYITEGIFTITEDDRVYELKPGNLIFKMPYEIHKSRVDKSPFCKYTTINFNADTELFKDLGDGVFLLDAEQSIFFNEIHEMINHNFDNPVYYVKRKPNASIVSEKIVFLYFEIFLLSLLKKDLDNTVIQHSASAINYTKIVNTMKINVEKNLSVKKIAELCNMSEGNLKKIFAKYSPGGVIKYFNTLKIKAAMYHLKNDLSVSDVSDKLGFSSPSYFCTMFLRETGMTPGEYKQKENKLII